MTMSHFMRTAAMALALAGTAVAPAVAQAPPAAEASGPDADAAQGWRKPSERVEARIAYIKAALKITDAQLPQFNALADVMRKHAAQMDARFGEMKGMREKMKSMSAIQRLELRQEFMAKGAEMTGELLAAAKPLYAVLDADQKKIADDLVKGPRDGMRGGHGFGPKHGPF